MGGLGFVGMATCQTTRWLLSPRVSSPPSFTPSLSSLDTSLLVSPETNYLLNLRNFKVCRFAEPKRHPLIKYNCVLTAMTHTQIFIFSIKCFHAFGSVIDCKDKKSTTIKAKMLLKSNIL